MADPILDIGRFTLQGAPPMQPTQFMDAVHAVIKRDPSYDVGAYYFLKDALDFTVKRVMENNAGEHRHVAASELLIGFRDLALQEFGPMASTMMKEWRLLSCTDIGTMVFQLIDEGVFGKQDSDTMEDFAELFPLHKTLDAPFLPKNIASRRSSESLPFGVSS
ncbi:MAG: hypothetical protein KJO21_13425 [Verrucomicrobiae bacterium]|nr:hypothetical protein [Verrucomicrobiae bacterium]NNJ44320.1 hypothetical protein [Akkermansiaceae bacterium]